MSQIVVIAIGGNSLIRSGEKGSVAEQLANARRTAATIVGLIRRGHRLVLTHGNGPQVGAQLLRSDRARDQVPGQTLDVCGAASQGEIGYILSQSLNNELAAAGLTVPVVSVITQTIVSGDDPAMTQPTKPIGPFYSRAEAIEREQRLGWKIVEDAARGYRRVVPSPEPIEIVELDVIRGLVEQGALVIACGGGGIPVVRMNGGLRGVEAVIDKDRASALLASLLGVDTLVISTGPRFVYLDYKMPTMRPLARATASEAERFLKAGQFPAGSMGPKVEAALQFLRKGGKEVIITSCQYLGQAIEGSDGTHIIPDGEPLGPDVVTSHGGESVSAK
jgi:carbamate kinase